MLYSFFRFGIKLLRYMQFYVFLFFQFEIEMNWNIMYFLLEVGVCQINFNVGDELVFDFDSKIIIKQ